MALTKVTGQGIDNVTVDSSGNVGIGITSPSTNLDVTGTSRYTFNVGNAYTLQTSLNAAGSSFADDYKNASQHIWQTSGTERMRITSGGHLLVGKTTQDSTNTVGFEAKDDGEVISTVNAAQCAVFNRKTSDGGIVVFRKDNTTVGSVSVTGSSTSYNTSSDYRLKENVTDITGATERLKQLNPVRFNFIVDADTTVDGFLAHEVQTVVPEAITGTHNEVDDDGNPVYQGIDQSKLVPLLVATIQELEARIAALETA